MVTLAFLLTFFCMFILVIGIDSILYRESMWDVLLYMFEDNVSMGKVFLALASIIGLAVAVMNDIRNKKSG
ncbi:hypothetical protein [Bacillus alkalicellulosilyticus]|uniref:hypothetical protein n=1 Tax=Alkalihalobacterium alkalicellulosilyticum TaxID=1912214 RepID=UPI0009985240|nr:hypothetical protein [Bacillus alkalicellulosilyticus]